VKKILYLCPEVPFPSDTGGKMAFKNHLNLLIQNEYIIDAVFLNVNDYKSDISKDWKKELRAYYIFERKVPNIRTIRGKFLFLWNLFFSSYPRAVSVRRHSKINNLILDLTKSNTYDLVIFDHFSSFGFISSEVYSIPIKKVYIAHNIESFVWKDSYENQKGFEKFIAGLELKKTLVYEKRILHESSKIITISSNDRDFLKTEFPELKIQNISEILPPQSRRWRYDDKVRTLLFVGGTNYYPNYEAVDWLVKCLMPKLFKLDKSICCKIVGINHNYPKVGVPENVQFVGRVDDEELEYLYVNSTVFISPVSLGSGVKIKVLTALSYAIPLLCTSESLNGIDLPNKDEMIIDRNNISETIQKISKLFNSGDLMLKSKLLEESCEFQYCRIKHIWQTVLNED